MTGDDWKKHFIQTYSGQTLYLADHHPAVSDIVDIAVPLSRIPRYGGHSTRVLTVAEHSIRGAEVMLKHWGKDAARAFLFHDAHEAFVGDVTKPLGGYLDDEKMANLKDRLDRSIFDKFDVDMETWRPLVKRIDNELLYVEWKEVMHSEPEEEGIERHHNYTDSVIHTPEKYTVSDRTIAQYFVDMWDRLK